MQVEAVQAPGARLADDLPRHLLRAVVLGGGRTDDLLGEPVAVRWYSRCLVAEAEVHHPSLTSRWRVNRAGASVVRCAPRMPRRPFAALVLRLRCPRRRRAAAASPATRARPRRPQIGKQGTQPQAAQQLGFPHLRHPQHHARGRRRRGGRRRRRGPGRVPRHRRRDPTRRRDAGRRQLVAGRRRGQRALLAPLRAPILLTEGGDAARRDRSALKRARPARRAQGRERAGAPHRRGGRARRPEGQGDRRQQRVRHGGGDRPAAEQRRRQAVVGGHVTSSERPDFAMPAAGYAAKSGDPVLFTRANQLPPETVAALKRPQEPRHLHPRAPSRSSPRRSRASCASSAR